MIHILCLFLAIIFQGIGFYVIKNYGICTPEYAVIQIVTFCYAILAMLSEPNGDNSDDSKPTVQ